MAELWDKLGFLESLREIVTGTSAETVGLERCSGLILTEGWGLGTRPFSTREATGFHKGAGQSDHKDQGFVVARPGLL